MVELLTSGAMSNRMLLLIFASFFSIFPAMFLIFGIMMRRGQQNNISSYDGEVKGEIIEVLNSEKSAMFATYPIYQYEVNKHKYIVKPNFIFFNSSLDKKYHDSENVTCITYLNKHGGNTRTKYKVGESIIIKYDIDNPKNHEILNDKDKKFAYDSRRIVALLLMIFPLIFFITSFFIKGQAVFTPAN